MTLHYATRMNDEAHGHAQARPGRVGPLGPYATTLRMDGASQKPGYIHSKDPKKSGKKNWSGRAPASDQLICSEQFNPAFVAPSSDDGRGILRDFSASPPTGFARPSEPQATMLQSAPKQVNSDCFRQHVSADSMPDNPYTNKIKDEPGVYLRASKWARQDVFQNDERKFGHGLNCCACSHP